MANDYNKPTGETMSEGLDIPGGQTPSDKPGMGKPAGQKVYVPIASLAMPGEDDHMNNPEMGDTVEFHAQGKVTSIEGDKACVELATVNGDPVSAEASATNDTPGGDEFAQLRQESAERMM